MKTENIKYILCDMDGTLLNEKKELSPTLFPLLEELKRRGIVFGAASGRQFYNLYERFSSYAKHMVFIAENGSMMFEGDHCIYKSEISYDQLIAPVKRIREAKQAWGVLCGVKSAYIEQEHEEFVRNCKMYYHKLTVVHDLLEAAKHDEICKIAIYDAIDTEKNTYPFMQGYDASLHMVTSGLHWIDMTNPNVTKGGAIQELKRTKQVKKEELMAFGDYMNDAEMLKECDHSYAMANAHPDILKLARHTCYSNEEDGVVKAICAYFNISYDTLKKTVIS